MAKLDPIVQTVEAAPSGRLVVLDASQLISLDTTGLEALAQLLKAVELHGARLRITALNEQPRSLTERSGFAARLEAHQASHPAA